MDYNSSNALKTPFGLSMAQFANKKIADAVAQLGGRLPCQVVAVAGQIVTVSFEINAAPFTLPQVSMPVATSVYDWEPIQIGDQGVTTTADVYMGGVSGLGGGAAGLSRPGNLTALVFQPVANAAWLPPGGDQNMRVTQGPDGVLIQDLTGAVIGKFSKTGGITLSFGGNSIVINSSGITINGQGNTTIESRVFLNHEHKGVQTGGGVTQGVV